MAGGRIHVLTQFIVVFDRLTQLIDILDKKDVVSFLEFSADLDLMIVILFAELLTSRHYDRDLAGT